MSPRTHGSPGPLAAPEPIELGEDSVPAVTASPAVPAAGCDDSTRARRSGDPYRQMYRVMRDLRTVVTERNRGREAMRRLQRESIARLALAAARGRREALDHGLRDQEVPRQGFQCNAGNRRRIRTNVQRSPIHRQLQEELI